MGTPSSLVWVPGLPLDASSLRLDLAVLATAETGEKAGNPFVTLGTGGRYSTVHLARLALADGTALKYLAVKVQRHAWRAPTSGMSTRIADNPEIEAMWRRERENLRCARGAAVVPHFDLAAGKDMAPVTFCRTQKVLFTPPSPQTGAALEVCRDDRLLRDSGLEPYSESTVRYLYAPEQHEVGGGDPLTFYTWSTTDGQNVREGNVVRRRGELYRDLERLCDGGAPDDRRARLERSFPCIGCEHRAECYASGGALAEERLVPLTYYPSPVVVTELMDLQFDEWCDLLGGAEPVAPLAPGLPIPGRTDERAAGLATGPQFFFASTKGPEFRLEALHLKLLACRQACAGLRTFQECTGRPHLGVSPENIMVQIPEATAGLPRRWQFATRLVDLGAQHRFRVPGASDDVELLLPAPDAPTSYQSPFVDPAAFGQELTMRLTIQSVEETGDGQRLTVDAKAQGSRVSGPRPGDVVSIEPHTSLPGVGELTLTGTVDKVQPAGGQFTVHLEADRRVADDILPFTCGGNVTFFRRFQAPCDLFGVGVLLSRALLVNDEQDLFQVEDAIRRVLEKLELAVAGVEEPDRRYIVTTLGNLVDDARFDSGVILYRAEDRRANVAEVPDPATEQIWFDTLLLIFRLLTSLPQFSFCAHHGDYEGERPSHVFEEVEKALEGLLRRTQVELFGKRARGRDVAQLCEGLLADINAELYGEEASP